MTYLYSTCSAYDLLQEDDDEADEEDEEALDPNWLLRPVWFDAMTATQEVPKKTGEKAKEAAEVATWFILSHPYVLWATGQMFISQAKQLDSLTDHVDEAPAVFGMFAWLFMRRWK